MNIAKFPKFVGFFLGGRRGINYNDVYYYNAAQNAVIKTTPSQFQEDGVVAIAPLHIHGQIVY